MPTQGYSGISDWAGTRILTTNGRVWIIDRTRGRPDSVYIGYDADVLFESTPDLVQPDQSVIEVIQGFIRAIFDPSDPNPFRRVIFRDPASETGCTASGTDLVFGRGPGTAAITVAVGDGLVICENPEGEVREVGQMEWLEIGRDGMGSTTAMSDDEWEELVAPIAPTAVLGNEISGSWSGTRQRNDTGASGSFTLTIDRDPEGRLAGTFLGQEALSVSASPATVIMVLEPASGCVGARLRFSFVDGEPVGGNYSVYGEGEACGRTGTYTFGG